MLWNGRGGVAIGGYRFLRFVVAPVRALARLCNDTRAAAWASSKAWSSLGLWPRHFLTTLVDQVTYSLIRSVDQSFGGLAIMLLKLLVLSAIFKSLARRDFERRGSLLIFPFFFWEALVISHFLNQAGNGQAKFSL